MIEMTLNMYVLLVQYNQNHLNPTSGPKSQMKQKQIWSVEEDQFIKRIAQEQKNSVNWVALIQKLKKKFPHVSRSEIQCQQRYEQILSHIEPHHPFNDWSVEQTNLLFKLFEIWGSKWTKIAHQMQGKTQNCVKNRFYGSLRKALRKLNRAARNLTKKFKKQLKYESITRIIDASEGLFRLFSPLKEQSEELSKKILNLAKKTEDEMPCEEAEEMIIEINKFNMATRSYKSKKKIKNSSDCGKKYKVELQSKSSNAYSTENYCSKQVKIEQEMESQHPSHSTEQQNEDFGYALLFKSGTTADFSTKEESKLRDYQLQEAQNQRRRMSSQSVQDLFTQLHSPLECELWI